MGSVVAASDNSGVATPYAYDAYGRPANDNWTGSRFRYTGQIALNDSASVHLFYYKNRVYDPVLGRFLQTDPIGYGDGVNWYVYVENDPVNDRDPSGLATNPVQPPPSPDEIVVTAQRRSCDAECAMGAFSRSYIEDLENQADRQDNLSINIDWVYSQSSHTLTHYPGKCMSSLTNPASQAGSDYSLTLPLQMRPPWKLGWTGFLEGNHASEALHAGGNRIEAAPG